MSKSKILFYFCLSFISGVFLASFLTPPLLVAGAGLILGILLVSVFWKYKKLVVFGFCLIFLVLGIWRYSSSILKKENNQLKNYNGKEALTLIGVVSSEPDVREENTKLKINLEKVIDNKNNSHLIKGKVLLTLSHYPKYKYGDELKIKGVPKTPPNFKGFNYKDYLAKEGIYSVIYYPKVEVIKRNQGNIFYRKILSFKEKLRESIYRNLSPPQDSILGAVLLGDKRRVSGDLKQELNITGLRHITAVSGLHVAILTSISMSLLLSLGFWRQQAFYLAIFMTIFFIIMTSLQISAIRAGIMGGFFLLAQYLGKLNSSSRVMAFVAAGMLAQNPLLLRWDVGFQLSFLAVMGIFYFAPFFKKWISSPPSKLAKKFIYYPKSFFYYFFSIILFKNSNLQNITAITLSAQVFTLPILIYNFGYISLISPLTNILIIPLLPYVMLSGFIFSLVGVIFQSLAQILSWPVWLMLTYITNIIDYFSRVSYASLEIKNLPVIFLVVFYIFLGYFAYRANKKRGLVSVQF